MFNPNYSISNAIINNIKKVTLLVEALNKRTFSKTVLFELERRANSLSAHCSTSIEGNPLPLTDVKQLLKTRPAHIRDTEREILNYNAALEDLNKKIGKGSFEVGLDLICQIQKQVTEGLIAPHRCGRLREEPVFVNDPRTAQPVYLPPDHQEVKTLLTELLNFVASQRGEIDALLLAGLFHKQFVLIHPFVDGNGRTARLATKTLLADMGLNTFNLFSFENYYNRDVTKYFSRVGEQGNFYEIVSSFDFTAWLEYFTDGIVDELLRVQKELEKETAHPQQTLEAHHQVILNIIKKKGFVTDRDYSRLTERAKATRALDFKRLLEMGLIERFGKARAIHYKLKN